MASSSSSPSSASGSHSSTSTSAVESVTLPPTMSTSDGLTPIPTTTIGPPGNGGDSFNNNAPSLASSASLYLYTFLATLVLLLSVSAAIVVRSFLLRRRHRRMIEEAIRNGTWVPPAPGSGRNGTRVDLSKKPKMWEAYMDLNHQQQQAVMMASTVEERDWESMKPVMANYVRDSARKKKSSNRNGGAGTGVVVTGGGSASGGGAGDEGGEGRGGAMTRGRRLFSNFTRTIGNAISPTPSGLPFGTVQPGSPNHGTGRDTQQGSNTDLHDMQMAEFGGSNVPPKVRVAVLIAMPRRHPSSTSSSSSASTLLTASRSPSWTSSTIPQMRASRKEEEEELPHIEMGVAELVVAHSSHPGSVDGGGTSAHHPHQLHHDAKGKVRESMASGGSL